MLFFKERGEAGIHRFILEEFYMVSIRFLSASKSFLHQLFLNFKSIVIALLS
jgi:hypothetical protein